MSLLTPILDTEKVGLSHFMAVRSDGLSYMVCLRETVNTPELVQEFERLYGTNLVRVTPIEEMIDRATGKREDDIQAFLRFVWNCVFIRVANITK